MARPLEPSLEGPGGEERLKALQRCFRTASKQAARARLAYPALVAGVFIFTCAGTVLRLRLGS